ncbi:MAG: hypothetical protein OXG77_06230 [Chloroflexi bacterium]|nr:hypothetical protein [Chloroflexota bacterium]
MPREYAKPIEHFLPAPVIAKVEAGGDQHQIAAVVFVPTVI